MGRTGFTRPVLRTTGARMVNIRTIYVLHATRQGSFEILRGGSKASPRLQSLHRCPDAISAQRWFNSTPSLFLQPSEWRVLADYADPVSCNITIPELGRQDARRFLQQRLRLFEPNAHWRQARPLDPVVQNSHSYTDPASVKPPHRGLAEKLAQALPKWATRTRWHWQFPRRWIAHALPDLPAAAQLKIILVELAQRPNTRIKGPYAIADLLAQTETYPSGPSTEVFRIFPGTDKLADHTSTAGPETSTLICLQRGHTVLFSRLMELCPNATAKLLPTLYAHQLLDRHSAPPAIETLAAGTYPHGFIHRLAHADARTIRTIPAFHATEPIQPAPRRIRQWLQKRPFASSVVAVLLASVSLLTGANVFSPTAKPPVIIDVPRAASPEPVVEPSISDSTPLVDLNAPLPTAPIPPKPFTSTENGPNDSYGWIRRSDGMVLRWQGNPSQNDGKILDTVAPNDWRLRRVQP